MDPVLWKAETGRRSCDLCDETLDMSEIGGVLAVVNEDMLWARQHAKRVVELMQRNLERLRSTRRAQRKVMERRKP